MNAIKSLWEGDRRHFTVVQLMGDMLIPILALVGFFTACWLAEKYLEIELAVLTALLLLSFVIYLLQPNRICRRCGDVVSKNSPDCKA